MPDTDAELLRCFAETRSNEAFEGLVRRHLNVVYYAALRQMRGDEHAAREIAQTVFIDLARKARDLSERPVLVSWLYTSTRYAAAKLQRERARRFQNELAAATMNALDEKGEAAGHWEAIRPLIDGVMWKLNERDRGAVLLRYFEGRPFAAIGEVYGISADAARVRVDRALEKMRRELSHRGVTSTAVALGSALSWQASAAVPSEMVGMIARAATTSTSLGSAVNLLTFMTTNKGLVLASSLAVLSFGTALYEVKLQRVGDRALQGAQKEIATTRHRMIAATDEVTSEEKAIAELKRSLDLANKSATPGAEGKTQSGVGSASASSTDPIRQGSAFLAAHPEVKNALVNRGRARIDARYYLLYADLHLTPEQIQRFESLMLERETITINYPQTGIMTLSAGTGMPKEQVDAGLRDLLGPDGYNRFNQLGQTINAQQVTLSLASTLYGTRESLNAAQAERVIALVSTADQGQGTRDWSSIVQGATSFLSPAQLAALRDVQAMDQMTIQLRRLSREP